MYSISICDAFKESRNSLENILHCYFKAKNILVRIRKYENFTQMLRTGAAADIVFIDEETVDAGGLRYARILHKCNPDLYVYVLGDRYKHLDAAMDLRVFRYLKKPVDLDRLYLSLNIILEAKKEVRFISNYVPVTLREDEIVCVYSCDRKTYVLTDLDQVYPTTLSMKEWEDRLKGLENFSRPHYSYVINMKHISSYDGKSIVLRCRSGKSVVVNPSQRRLGQFRNDYYSKTGAIT